MKRLITLFGFWGYLGVLFAQNAQTSIQIISQTPQETVVEIQFGDLQKTEVSTPRGKAFIIGVDKGTPRLQEGMPDIAKVAIPLMVPLKGKIAIELLEDETVRDEMDILVAPSKGNFKRNIKPEDVPYTFNDVYGQDNPFPEASFDLQSPFILRDARGVSVWVNPAYYYPESRLLVRVKKVRFKVYATDTPGENELESTGNRAKSRTFQQLYQHFFQNYDERLLLAQRSGDQPEKMLVLVNDGLEAALEPLITWKRQMGIHTTVVSLSEIEDNSPAGIYNYVYEYYNQHGITYLLLVGDEQAIVPMLRPGSPYSCDNCLGYMEGSDHFPEVMVGRYHASDAAQLSIMVKRNLEYEMAPVVDPAAGWCSSGLALCSNQGAGIGDDNQADYEHGNEWKAKHLADNFQKYWEFYDGDQSAISPTPGDGTADNPGWPVSPDLVALMNGRGVSLFNYTGHGSEQGLSSGNFNIDAVDNLRNTHKYPIMVAVACCVGNFTNGNCLGEALQRAGNPVTGETWGVIGGFFSSDFQSWAPPMEGQDGINQYLVDADGINVVPVMGAMAVYGNARMIAAYGTAGSEMADVWNPFCEPTFVARTVTPQGIMATHLPEIYLGGTSYTVECPVEGALVSLYFEGQTLAVATVVNGVATFSFEPLANVGEVKITATQFNYTPYQGSAWVVPSSGPYIVKQQVYLNDSAGNNNYLPDFGETIQLDVELKNIGLDPATATQVQLNSTNNYIQITDAAEFAGDIEDSTSVFLANAFEVKIDEWVPDQHLVVLEMSVNHTNGQIQTIPLTMKLNAPVLNIVNYTITESANSDNDGRFESGETIIITVKNKNSGHATTGLLTTSLSADASWLTVTPAQSLGVLAANITKDAVYYVQIGANAPSVSALVFEYTISDGIYSDIVVMDKILINPIIENFESQNFNTYPWVMSGEKPWAITTTNPYSGTYCARSGLIIHDQKSRMSMNIKILEAGNLSFAVRIGCEENYDFLRFHIDGVEAGVWTGTKPWSVVTYPLSAGDHTLTWTYEKDAFGTAQPDRAYVDDVILPPYETVVGIKEVDKIAGLSAQLFPNPASEVLWLNLSLENDTELEIRLLDIHGRELTTIAPARYIAGASQMQLPVSGLSAGSYLVQITNSQGVAAYPFVLMR